MAALEVSKLTSSEKPEKSIRDEAKRLQEIIAVITKHQIVKNGLTPETLKHLLEDLGPTYIKIGQIMSSRTDILPVEYCHALEELRSEVTPLPKEEMVRVVEEELGKPIGELFEAFGDKLLGSASIAQVYSATLKDGRKMVVKVQRPGIAESMKQDFELLGRAADMLKLAPVNNTIDFKMLLEELKETTKNELDFRIEAGNTREFYENCKDLKYASCPIIEDAYTTSRIMTMSFVDGFSIGKIEKLDELGYDRNEITLKLMDHFVKQVVDDGFFHADPHQGNIVISGSQIVWLDMGMVGRIGAKERSLMRNAILAVTRKDASMMMGVVLSLGDVHGEVDRPQLAMDIDSVMDRYLSLDIGDLDLAAILNEIVNLASKYHISMPKGFSMLCRAIITIEGVVAKLGSDYSVAELLSGHVMREMILNYDVKKDVILNGQAAIDSAKKALTIPSLTADALKTLSRGQGKFSVELVGLDKLFGRVEVLVGQLITALMVVALLIGSSLICMTDMTPKIFEIPLLGFIGFVAALIMGIFLYISMLKRPKDKK